VVVKLLQEKLFIYVYICIYMYMYIYLVISVHLDEFQGCTLASFGLAQPRSF
jgi:hypothetical protein